MCSVRTRIFSIRIIVSVAKLFVTPRYFERLAARTRPAIHRRTHPDTFGNLLSSGELDAFLNLPLREVHPVGRLPCRVDSF
jgi:hypothetical protein